MSFIIYDLIILGLFVIFLSAFLYKERKNLKKEGLLLLYKTEWGIKLIEHTGNKFKSALKILGYLSIALGYILMAGAVYMFGKIIWIYIAYPTIVRDIKIPPIMPLIPYIPQIFNLDYLPPFYFIYWIIIIAIIAITHEFSHGIFAVANRLKIKKTGFGFFPFFLPIFLAAFVELDEDEMKKKEKRAQMAILSAGTFANTLTFLAFLLISWIFFSLAFAPAGISFNDYAYSGVKISEINSINGELIINHSYQNVLSLVDKNRLNNVKAGDKDYWTTREFLEKQKNNKEYVFLYDDSPAVKAQIKGAISEINGVKIGSVNGLSSELGKISPGESVLIKTRGEGNTSEYNIILEKNPKNGNFSWLGVGFVQNKREGFIGSVISFVAGFKEANTYYEPRFSSASFIYNLLWWITIVSISVALVNMLPVGIFDGGRFFYLTVLAIIHNEKKAEKVFKFVTYLFLASVFVMLGSWAMSFFR